MASSVRLYVGNLPYTITDAELLAPFTEFGIVATRPQIIMDRETNRPRGFGFVEVGSQVDADRAVSEVSGYRLGGRPIKVSVANERPGRSGGGGGGGGGRPAPSFEHRGGGGGGGGGRRDRSESRGRNRDDDVWR